jgi:hypothetical protein
MKPFKILTSLILTAAAAVMISSALPVTFVAAVIALLLFSLIPFAPGQAFRTVVSNPLIGRSKQSMGGVTFTSWKGINVLKNKATSVANPNSPGQIQQRSAFAQVVLAFRQQPAAIRAGYKKLAVKKSEFNAFMAAALDEAFDFTVPGVATLLPALLVTSKGTISLTDLATATVDRSANTIVATFNATITQPGQALTDVALISAYNITQNKFTGEVSGDLRSTGTANIVLPADWNTGDTTRVYLGFYNPLSGESSDSDNIAATIVA